MINHIDTQMNEPQEPSMSDWKELMKLPAVKEVWGLDDEETPEEFASKVYGVKFHFVSGGPGYVGDLYILQGDALSESAPIAFIRQNGVLTSARGIW